MSGLALSRLVPIAALVLLACPQATPPQPALRSCESVIRFAPEQSTEAVTILGEWNGFTPEPMELGANGVSVFKRTLEPRDYGYRFAIGKAAPITDPANSFRRWAGTLEHSRLRVPDCTAPLLELTAFTAAGKKTGSAELQASRGSAGM